jgi:hypothetical protein
MASAQLVNRDKIVPNSKSGGQQNHRFFSSSLLANGIAR